MSDLYSVASSCITLVDNERQETLGPKEGPRKILVQLFYPVLSSDVSYKEKPEYVSEAKAKLILKSFRLSKKTLEGRKAPYYKDVPMMTESKFPLLLFSHGHSSFIESSSFLCADIASRGYIVASIGHAYEAVLNEYEDGTSDTFDKTITKSMYPKGMIKTLLAQRKLLKNEYSFETAASLFDVFQNEYTPYLKNQVDVWTKDSLFVLSEMEKRYKDYIDFSHGVAASGHSFGGATSYRLCLLSDKVTCGMNIDGALFGYTKDDILQKPFYEFCCVENWNCESMYLVNHSAPAYSALFSNMQHCGFTDIKFFSKSKLLVGSMSPEVMHKHLLEGHLFMLDKYLKNKDVELNKSSSDEIVITEY